MHEAGKLRRVDRKDGVTMSERVQSIDPIEALVLETPSSYGVEASLPDGRKFVYCYTALTSILVGGCVAVGRTGGATTAGRNPQATLPETDDNVAHVYGIACKTTDAAGGVWVQVYGRCTFAKVDGTSAVAIGDSLKPVDGAQYLVQDAAVGNTKTAAAVAFAEEAEAVAYGSQTVTTGTPDNTIFITGQPATL